MTDATLAFNELLEKHGQQLGSGRTGPSAVADEFLKEAYRINSHVRSLETYLRSIRLGYLSTTLPPHRRRTASVQNRQYFTDAQRDQIDAESKATLRDLNAGIGQLERIEQLRRDTEAQIAAKKRSRNGFQSLSRWAGGGMAPQTKLTPGDELEEAKQNAISAHRESVIWFLRRKLEITAEVQGGMMERRLERELEKSKSVLSLAKSTGITVQDDSVPWPGNEKGHQRQVSAGNQLGTKGAALNKESRQEIEQSLNPEQLQIFAQENNELLKHYEDTLDQVRAAERSMVEISELQTTLAQNLEIQSTRIDQLVEDSANTEQNVLGGNKQLKRATERWRPARFVFYTSCGLSVFLIIWDLIF